VHIALIDAAAVRREQPRLNAERLVQRDPARRKPPAYQVRGCGERLTTLTLRSIHESFSATVPGSATWNSCWPWRRISIATSSARSVAAAAIALPSRHASSLLNRVNTNRARPGLSGR